MKKIIILAVVLLAVSGGVVYAQESNLEPMMTITSGPCTVYTDLNHAYSEINGAFLYDLNRTLLCLDGQLSKILTRLTKLEGYVHGGLPTTTTYPIPYATQRPIPPACPMTCSYSGPGPNGELGEGICYPSCEGTPVVSGSGGSTNVGFGKSNDSVKNIQNILKAEGYFNYPTATGYFGSITESAIKNFQAAHGIQASGQIDAKTLELLNAAVQTRAKAQ